MIIKSPKKLIYNNNLAYRRYSLIEVFLIFVFITVNHNLKLIISN